jgi:hypothetical protein
LVAGGEALREAALPGEDLHRFGRRDHRDRHGGFGVGAVPVAVEVADRPRLTGLGEHGLGDDRLPDRQRGLLGHVLGAELPHDVAEDVVLGLPGGDAVLHQRIQVGVGPSGCAPGPRGEVVAQPCGEGGGVEGVLGLVGGAGRVPRPCGDGVPTDALHVDVVALLPQVCTAHPGEIGEVELAAAAGPACLDRVRVRDRVAESFGEALELAQGVLVDDDQSGLPAFDAGRRVVTARPLGDEGGHVGGRPVPPLNRWHLLAVDEVDREHRPAPFGRGERGVEAHVVHRPSGATASSRAS